MAEKASSQGPERTKSGSDAYAELTKARDDEFKRYHEYRPGLISQQLHAEKGYDALLVTLSSGAIGGSIVLLKDLIGTDRAVAVWAMGFALLSFVVCLGLSLYHRKLTFDTHKQWRDILDAEFTNWSEPGAFERAGKKYDTIPGITRVEKLKDWAFYLLVAGVFVLSLFLLVNLFRTPAAGKGNAPAPQIIVPNVTVNIGTPASTQPTKP